MPRSIKSHIAKELFLCSLSALLLILAFPRSNISLFAFIGFIPLFFILENKSKAKAFLFAYLTGVIFWAGIIYWLVHVTLPGTAVLILYLSLYFGFFGLVVATIEHRASSISFLIIPSLWVLLEYTRSYLLTGFPWALLAYSQYKNLAFIQIADITGAWGVSFLIMMVNVSIYSLLSDRPLVLGKIKRLAVPALLIILSFSYGYYKLHPTHNIQHLSPIKISVIQGNIAQELKWDPNFSAYIVGKYSRLTQEAAVNSPDLIIWPEASSPGLFGEDTLIFEDIFALAKKTKSELLIGTVSKDKEDYYNSALLIDVSGKVSGRYDKIHLVPFGEYIPLKKIFPFFQTVVPIGDIAAGKDYAIFKSRKVNFSVLICFEDLFPELSREFIKKGADFLVNITNDAWYKKTSAAYQHFQASVFRAVENRVFLVRSANTGVSGFISPLGKIISLVKDKSAREIFVSGFDTQELAVTKKNISFYTKYGDIFPAVCLLIFLYGIIAQSLKKR